MLLLFAVSGCTEKPTVSIEYCDLVFKDGLAYYEENAFTGIAVEYHDNGSLLYQDSFLNGKLNGICKAWYENGKPMHDRITKKKNHTVDGYYGIRMDRFILLILRMVQGSLIEFTLNRRIKNFRFII